MIALLNYFNGNCSYDYDRLHEFVLFTHLSSLSLFRLVLCLHKPFLIFIQFCGSIPSMVRYLPVICLICRIAEI